MNSGITGGRKELVGEGMEMIWSSDDGGSIEGLLARDGMR